MLGEFAPRGDQYRVWGGGKTRLTLPLEARFSEQPWVSWTECRPLILIIPPNELFASLIAFI